MSPRFRSHPLGRHRCNWKGEKSSSASSRSVKSNSSHSTSESDNHSTHNRSGRAHRSKNYGGKVLLLVNNCFCDTLAYHNYCFADKSSDYDDHVTESVAKWAKRLQVQVKTHGFDSPDPISITRIFSKFKLTCETNRIHKGRAMWLLLFFMKNLAAAASDSRIALSSKYPNYRKELKLTSYSKVIKSLLDT